LIFMVIFEKTKKTMKKIFTLIAAIALFSGVQAQDSRAVPKGKNSVNLYYGYNAFTSVYKSIATDAGVNVKFKSLGPVGIVYEHMMTDVVGLGVEAGYGSTTMSYDYDVETYLGNGNYQTNVYTASAKFATIRAMLRTNFHLVKDENFDCYILISAGYRNTSFSWSTNEPGATYSGTFKFPFNFGLKPGLGLRYFFNNAIGIHAEIAAGTPLACGGLSFRF
jgi:hypothetical protein